MGVPCVMRCYSAHDQLLVAAIWVRWKSSWRANVLVGCFRGVRHADQNPAAHCHDGGILLIVCGPVAPILLRHHRSLDPGF